MPRVARAESTTGYYHIMMRGIDREYIYKTPKDKEYFLNLLKAEERIDVAAFCLMDNHVHLLLKAELSSLAEAIRRLNVKYAMHYNFSHSRVGHVFQNRFKSEAVDTDKDLMQVIRYIHNNPAKAKIVKDIGKYTWSSYCEYLGEVAVIAERQKAFVLSMFSDDVDRFRQFHLEKDEQEYLDTKEEIAQNRLDLAQDIIEEYCIQKGIVDSRQIYGSPEHVRAIVTELLKRTKLSHRKMASLLGIDPNVVHQVSRERNEGED